MNYRAARQIQEGPRAGKWHYTCRNDDRIWVEGACAQDCPGHDTPEEAYEHERQRLIAELEITELGPDERVYSPGRCDARDSCTNPATYRVIMPHPFHIESPRLCSAHATREQAARLVFVGESAASW